MINITLSLSDIITAIVGPLIVGATLLWIGDRAANKRLKSDAIRDLMAYRGDYSTPEFRRSLNKVSIIFNKDADTRKEIRELYEAINNPSTQEASINRKIVGLIYNLCRKNGFSKITEYDIDQSFQEARQTPLEEVEPLSVLVPTQAASSATPSSPTATTIPTP